MRHSKIIVKQAAAACTLLLILATSAFPIKHQFIAIDEGLKNLLYINENDSTKNWLVSVSSVYSARDMQLVGNNRILIGHNNGYTEYDITTGAIKRQVLTYDSVSSVRRLPNGQTVLFGVDMAGSKGVVMIKLDSNNVQIKKTVFPGTYVRMARQTNTGTYLLACNDTIKEADTNGNFIWKKYIRYTAYPTNKHMWKAERLDNGHILLSGGYGAFLAEIDTAGNFIRTIGTAPQATGINPFFYAMYHMLSNSDIVVANWQGHGAGNATKGTELLEYTSAGAIVWQWNKPSLVSSIQGVLVLDSLNTNLMYDDRNGYMLPIKGQTSVLPQPAGTTGSSRAMLKGGASGEYLNVMGRSIQSIRTNDGRAAVGSGMYVRKPDAHSDAAGIVKIGK
jgi:hypothetical protein